MDAGGWLGAVDCEMVSMEGLCGWLRQEMNSS